MQRRYDGTQFEALHLLRSAPRSVWIAVFKRRHRYFLFLEWDSMAHTQVPSPTAGILKPELSLNVRPEAIAAFLCKGAYLGCFQEAFYICARAFF